MCVSLTLPALAVEEAQPVLEEIAPRNAYTNKTVTSLSISSGTATCLTDIQGYRNITTKVQIFMYLQQYDTNKNKWVTIDSWSISKDSYRAAMTEESSVDRGYTYRIMASYYAYSGSDFENIVQYSPEYYY